MASNIGNSMNADLDHSIEAGVGGRQRSTRDDDKKKKIRPVNVEKLEPLSKQELFFSMEPT